MRGETPCTRDAHRRCVFQSTPLMRGETFLYDAYGGDLILISIHSPHARGDCFSVNINYNGCQFQSTPLMRGETQTGKTRTAHHTDFNPLPSCEGRPCGTAGNLLPVKISIHSPHARGDLHPYLRIEESDYFNPLPSCEGRLAC